MNLVHPHSLGKTLDAVNAAFFSGITFSHRDNETVAKFIAARHGPPGAYADTFALFDSERRDGFRLFTGERVSCASARHTAGQEACRVLRLLKPQSAAVQAALQAATASLARCVGPASPIGPKPLDGKKHWDWDYRGGTYCCGICTVGFWRHVLAGGFDRPQVRLARGLQCLRAFRRDDGQWHRFPFWYTVYALVEMECPAAREERRHAARNCERIARRTTGTIYAQRRSELARRLLTRM